MLKDLLANLAVVLSFLLAYTTAAGWLAERGYGIPKWVFASIMSVATLATMSMSFELAPGFIADLRNPLIVVGAIFGGVPAALAAAATAAVYRLFLGGNAWLGLTLILASAAVGLVIRARRPDVSQCLTCYVAGAAGIAGVGLAGSVLGTVLSGSRVDPTTLASNLALNAGTVLLLGLLLGTETQRRRLSRINCQYRAMVDTLPDCLNLKDAEGRFIAANPATARLVGASDHSELIGKTDADFYPPDLAAAYERDDREAIARGEAVIIEQPGNSSAGVQKWLSTLKAPAFDTDGKFVGLITSNRDITAKKALESELARMRAYFEQALQQMTDGLAIFDDKGVLQFANAPYRELFPVTGHLRVAGAKFADIVRESVSAGEESLRDDVCLEDHCAERVAALYRSVDYRMTLSGGRTYEVRTRVMENGHSLRIVTDITDRIEHEGELLRLALHDTLTGLPNRAYFEQEFAESMRVSNGLVVLMLIDLDHFKQVNDQLGHLAGDALLVEASSRMKSVLRQNDFIARIGGDEFAVLLSGAEAHRREADIASRLVQAVGLPMVYQGESLRPGATIGIARSVGRGDTLNSIVKRADTALYAAKQSGRGTWKSEVTPLARKTA